MRELGEGQFGKVILMKAQVWVYLCIIMYVHMHVYMYVCMYLISIIFISLHAKCKRNLYILHRS